MGRRTKWPGHQHKGSSWRKKVEKQDAIDEERKKQGQERILAEHLSGLERNSIYNFETHASAPVQGKIELNELSKEEGQPK